LQQKQAINEAINHDRQQWEERNLASAEMKINEHDKFEKTKSMTSMEKFKGT